MKGCVCFVGSASCRAFGHTRPASVPGLSVGLPPLVQARMLVVSHTKPLHDAVAQMADDLYGGFAPKQGCFGCLPKVLHDAKPAEQATLDTPFLSSIEVFRQSGIRCFLNGGFQLVGKVYFYKYRANSLSLTPNPFPVGRGYITGATAPRPSKDACSQPHKATARRSGTNG